MPKVIPIRDRSHNAIEVFLERLREKPSRTTLILGSKRQAIYYFFFFFIRLRSFFFPVTVISRKAKQCTCRLFILLDHRPVHRIADSSKKNQVGLPSFIPYERKWIEQCQNSSIVLHWVCSISFPGSTPVYGIFFPGRTCADNYPRSSWGKKTPHTGVDPGKLIERTLLLRAKEANEKEGENTYWSKDYTGFFFQLICNFDWEFITCDGD